MTWTRASLFTSETGRIAGQKGGKAMRVNGVRRTPEYRAGYQAGYKAGYVKGWKGWKKLSGTSA